MKRCQTKHVRVPICEVQLVCVAGRPLVQGVAELVMWMKRLGCDPYKRPFAIFFDVVASFPRLAHEYL